MVHETDDQALADVVDAEAVPELRFLREIYFRLDKNLQIQSLVAGNEFCGISLRQDRAGLL